MRANTHRVILVHRYKLRPTRAQHRRLEDILSIQRELYNAALQERRDAWRLQRRSITYNHQTASLTLIRAFDERHSSLPHCLGRWTLARLHDAFSNFFARIKRGTTPGFPRFKSKAAWTTFGLASADGVRLRGDRLLLKGLVGGLRIRLHRPIPKDGLIKRYEFSRRGRDWFVFVTIRMPDPEPLDCPVRPIGVDVGVEAIATLSDGTRFANLRPGKAAAKRIRRIQQALSRTQRNSKRRRMIRERLRRVSQRAADVRTNHLHHVANDIVARGDLIAVEDLKILDMTRSASSETNHPFLRGRARTNLNRSMRDAAPGRLIEMIAYKAERAGGAIIAIDPRGTSQTCSSCHEKVPKGLGVRLHECPCGLSLHRDHNAAINILQRGMAAHAAGTGRGGVNRREPSRRSSGRPAIADTVAA